MIESVFVTCPKGDVMRFIVILFIVLFVFVGCNVVEDIKGMFEKQQLVQQAIKDKNGWDSQVSWNINNGILTHVSVVLSAEQVRDEKVSTLEEAVLDAVASSFESKPKVVYVQVACHPKEQKNSRAVERMIHD
jgi:uncharacterized protein YcfL